MTLREKYQQYIQEINRENDHGNNFIDINDVFPITENVDILIKQIEDLKQCLDSFRPLNPLQLQNLNEFYEVNYTYESNRIEGNTLTLQETFLVLNKGITIAQKPMQDHLEAVNHKEAFRYIQKISKGEEDFSNRILLDIHELVLHGIDSENGGKYRNIRVRISNSLHIPPNPIKVYDLMQRYFEHYDTQKSSLNPVVLAADMHEKLVTIHPFIDGNGRTARLVMNLILLKNGYPIINISGSNESRMQYYQSLEDTQTQKNPTAFQLYILQQCKIALWNYLQLFADNIGESEATKGGYFFERIRNLIDKD